MPNNTKVFRTGTGYATASSREDWIRAHGADRKGVPDGLVADRDPAAPLYPWQLHSILGPQRIEDLITCFYKKVFADDQEKWFSHAFKRISDVDHHIWTQTTFWIDAMGGGKAYHGGDYRLKFHHEHNAESVMNAKGATRWMYHMRQAIKEQDYSGLDPRIKTVIMDFLKVKMMKYAKDHSWTFDDSDFALDGIVDDVDTSAAAAAAALPKKAPAPPPVGGEGGAGGDGSSGSSGGGSPTLDPYFVQDAEREAELEAEMEAEAKYAKEDAGAPAPPLPVDRAQEPVGVGCFARLFSRGGGKHKGREA